MNNYDSLQKYFVNLDLRVDRLKIIREQVGQDFIRWSACDGSKLDVHQLDSIFDMHKCYKKYNCYQSPSQASATISQYSLYKKIAEDVTISDEDFVLISEDDNRYIKNFKQKLDQLLKFVYTPRFENAEIIILKYLEIHEQIDYAEMLSYIKRPELSKENFNILRDKGFSERQIEVFSKYLFRHTMRIYKDHIFSFEYDVSNFPEHEESELFTKKQSLCAIHKIRPYSASCYLIRKRACKRIVKKYKKPFWFTDDFKQIVPVYSILVASPFLAIEPKEFSYSSINDTTTWLNHLCNNLEKNKSFRYSFAVLKHTKVLLSWLYSKSLFKRKISKFIYFILNV